MKASTMTWWISAGAARTPNIGSVELSAARLTVYRRAFSGEDGKFQ